MRKKLANTKKKLAYLLVGVLSVSMLAGCGSKTGNQKGSKVDVELTEVLENVAEAVTNIESIAVNLKGEADINVTYDGERQAVQGAVELSGKAVKEKPAFELKGNVNYKLDMDNDNISGERSITAYGETNSDEMEVYVKVNDEEWEKESADLADFYESLDELEEVLDEVKSSISKIDEEQLKEFEPFIKLEDTTAFVNNKECYVLAAEINDGNLIDLLKLCEEYAQNYYEDEEWDEEEENSDISPYIGPEYEEDEDASVLGIDYELVEEELKDISFKLEYQLYFDKKSYFPVKFDYGMTINGVIDEAEINVNKLKLEIDFSVNDVKVSKVPDEVKEVAVEEDIDLDYIDSYIGSEYDSDMDWKDEEEEQEDNDRFFDDDYDYEEDASEEYDDKWGLTEGSFNSEYTKIPQYVIIDGIKLNMYDDFSVIDNLKLELYGEEDDLEEEVEPQDEAYLFFETEDTREYFSVDVYNPGKTTVKAKECRITGIGTGISGSELENGIKVGDSIEKVKEVYAGVEPADSYFGSAFCYCTYEDEEENEVDFMFDYETGIIDMIEITNYS